MNRNILWIIAVVCMFMISYYEAYGGWYLVIGAVYFLTITVKIKQNVSTLV